MKTNLKKIMTAFILAAVFCTGLSAQDAEVISAKGKVEFSEDKGNTWTALNVGDKIKKGYLIGTGFQSEAKIKYGESILQLGALSRVTLETLSSDSEKDVVSVYLNTGAVRSKVSHTADKKVNYTVRNPIAVASVRGTDFSFRDNGTAKCSSGAIALAPARYYEPETLEPGKTADEVESPADGESDAATPATDIAPSAPKGSVVVLGGQSAAVSTTGATTPPMAAANNNANKAAAVVTTAATSEGVSSAPAAPAPAVIPAPAPEAPKTGNIAITVIFE